MTADRPKLQNLQVLERFRGPSTGSICDACYS